jgi:hypothetical protein
MPAYKTKEEHVVGFEKKDTVKVTEADKAAAARMILLSDDALKLQLDILGIGYRESGRLGGRMCGNHSHAHAHTHTHALTHTQFLLCGATSHREHIHKRKIPPTASKSLLGQLLAKGVLSSCQLFVFLSLMILSYPFCRIDVAGPDLFDAVVSFMSSMPAELKQVFEITYDRTRKTMKAKMVVASAAATSASALDDAAAATSASATDASASATDASDDAASDASASATDASDDGAR